MLHGSTVFVIQGMALLEQWHNTRNTRLGKAELPVTVPWMAP